VAASSQPESRWNPPALTLKWGAYTKSDPDEEQKQITAVGLALDKGICTKRMALEKLRGVFGIENVEKALEALEEESEANREREAEDMAKIHEAMNGDGGKPEARGGPNQARAFGNRGGGAAPAKAPRSPGR